ncbi:MAG: hypothetical protein KA319_01210 [Ferruginibacter sp.]|nr:hypothetical protein [Ferruginibacter sp.]
MQTQRIQSYLFIGAVMLPNGNSYAKPQVNSSSRHNEKNDFRNKRPRCKYLVQ